jgi:hypothetical protein
MSAKFTDTPAEEFEREFLADEMLELRKTDGPARRLASNSAAAFNALLDAGGISAEAHQPLHIFLDKTRGLGPDEEVRFFSDREAGALLPGVAGASPASLAKRWTRAWNEILVPEMARTKKRFAGRRENGSIRLASRIATEKKTAPRYFSDIAQAVVDV